jgi:ParE toxin of type II toxin-antitoxin system, parDE
LAFQIYFQEEAIIDIQDTYYWYESQLKNLGEEFLDELNAVLEKLKTNPQYFGYSFDEFRDARLKRFPYLIVYKIERNKVYINSIKHIRRKPGSR